MGSSENWFDSQRQLCARLSKECLLVAPEIKVGVSRNLKGTLVPVNGLRHSPEGDTSGWYFWAGEELSDAPDFFVPLHAAHLAQWRPELIPYLGLPPGSRLLLADQYEDVWQDESLLKLR